MADLRTGTAADNRKNMVTLNGDGLLANGHDNALSGGGLTDASIGTKTVTNTPAEVFAGTSAKSGRTHLTIKVADNDIRIRIGTGSANLERDGLPIEPGQSVSIPIRKGSGTPLYAVSEGAHVEINVIEF